MTQPVLSVQNLSISYGWRETRLPVIEDVSFEIAPGEAFGLVGESGCGKSTVALALVRYLAANGSVDHGSISIDGEDVFALEDEALRRWRGGRVAMVYQEAGSALNPSLRVGDQIAEVFSAHADLGHAEALGRARELLERVSIADPELMLRRYPHQLSGGQQQRVVIAMALAGNPRLLILDEPTTGLDTTIEAEVIDLIAELRRELDVAILFISHNLGLVSRVCDRVGILYSGRIVEQGSAAEVLAAPRHPYTHGLVRCVPPFGASKRTLRLEPIPGTLPALGEAGAGCRFAPRCALVQDICRSDEPELLTTGPERLSRCHFWEQVEGLPARATPTVAVAAPVAANGSGDLLALRELRRSFGAVTACDDVTLEIGRGEIFGLVGESGSGKTTLVNCIAGLVAPDSGELLYDGEPLARRVESRSPLARRRLQMVFQNPDSTLNPSHTIAYVLGRAIRRLAGRRSVAELAEEVRIPDRVLQARSAGLSGGQKQRVAIARAFAGSPELVLCDEPVSALDVSVQAAVLNLLADLQEAEGVSYVFISHDLGVVRYLADRIGVMYLGQLVEVGAAADVFDATQHPYTEALVSAIPTLDAAQRRERIRLHGSPPSLASPPSGCRFHTRCPRKIGAICETDAPPWRDAGDGHRIRCHYAVEELRSLQTAPRATSDAL